MYACYLGGGRIWRTAYTHSMVARRAPARLGAWCGGAGRSGRGGVVQREVVCAMLEVVDPVLDVLGVRVHGRRDDLRQVVGEEVGGVETRVARPVPPALPVLGTAGKKAEASQFTLCNEIMQPNPKRKVVGALAAANRRKFDDLKLGAARDSRPSRSSRMQGSLGCLMRCTAPHP